VINIDVDGLCEPVSELLRSVGREELPPRFSPEPLKSRAE